MMDAYDRTAKLAPAYIIVFPQLCYVWLALASLGSLDLWLRFASLLIAAGLPLLLIETIRDLGHRKQAQLWTEWGGPPTITALRVANSRRQPNLSWPAACSCHENYWCSHAN